VSEADGRAEETEAKKTQNMTDMTLLRDYIWGNHKEKIPSPFFSFSVIEIEK